jgi:hypothetical protein
VATVFAIATKAKISAIVQKIVKRLQLVPVGPNKSNLILVPIKRKFRGVSAMGNRLVFRFANTLEPIQRAGMIHVVKS